MIPIPTLERLLEEARAALHVPGLRLMLVGPTPDAARLQADLDRLGVAGQPGGVATGVTGAGRRVATSVTGG